MGHEDSDQEPSGAVDDGRAGRMAVTLTAIADPVRLKILTALREGPRTADDLAASLEVPGTELSEPLERLVEAGLVGAGDELPPSTVYALFDDHVEAMLDEAVSHEEHRRHDLDDRVAREL